MQISTYLKMGKKSKKENTTQSKSNKIRKENGVSKSLAVDEKAFDPALTALFASSV